MPLIFRSFGKGCEVFAKSCLPHLKARTLTVSNFQLPLLNPVEGPKPLNPKPKLSPYAKGARPGGGTTSLDFGFWDVGLGFRV